MLLLVCLLFSNTIMTTESTCSYNITRKNGTRHYFVWMCAPIINHTLKSEVATTLHLLLYYTCYTVLQMCKKLLCMNPMLQKVRVKSKESLNAGSSNPSYTEMWGSHCVSFVAMLYSLHSVINKQQCKKLLCIESRSLQKMREKSITKPVGSHIALSQIDTLCCQRKELEHKGGQR